MDTQHLRACNKILFNVHVIHRWRGTGDGDPGEQRARGRRESGEDGAGGGSYFKEESVGSAREMQNQ